VRTSHSLGFRAVQRAYRIKSGNLNSLKLSYLLDRLIPGEPDTDSQRDRLRRLAKAVLQRLTLVPAHTEAENQILPNADHASDKAAGYRYAVTILATLAKQEAFLPRDTQAIDRVLTRFTPYYRLLRASLAALNRAQLIDYAGQALELSLPRNGVLEEYDFSDLIWLPAIAEEVPLESVDTLLIEDRPGFYQAEKRMVERWRRAGARIVEIIAEPRKRAAGPDASALSGGEGPAGCIGSE
jgi:hypothetical protein